MNDGILFNYIPASGLTAPIFSFEFNSGGQYQQVDRFIIVGHKTSAGLIALNSLVPASDQNSVDLLAGPGSMLREMFRICAANAPAAPFYLLAVAEVGIAPIWTLTVNALSGTGVGTILIENQPVTVTVGPTDTPASVAAALAVAVNGYYNALTAAMLTVTASSSGATVTFTSRHAGVIFNETDFFAPSLVGQNLFAAQGAITIARTTDGAGNPVVGTALATLGDDPADYVVSPWMDPFSMQSYDSFTNDTSGRWAWNRQSYGHVWGATTGNFAQLVAFGATSNSRHITPIGRIASPQAAYAISMPANPVAGQTVSIAGTVVTFGAGAGQVAVGGTVSATLANLLAMLQASTDPGIGKFVYTVGTAASGAPSLNLFAVTSGTLGNYLTVATTVASATVAQVTVSNGNPHAAWRWAAGFTSRVSPWLSDCDTGNVSRNQTNLVIQEVMPPRDRAVWPNYNARNVLNNNGISTWHVGQDGSLQIDKIVTMYKTGTAGQPDIVFRDIQSVYQVSGGTKYLRALLAEEQANKALSDTNPGGLGALTTPADIKGTFVHGVTDLQNRGVLKQAGLTAAQMILAFDPQNPARVNVFLPEARVSPFDILATNATIYQNLPVAA